MADHVVYMDLHTACYVYHKAWLTAGCFLCAPVWVFLGWLIGASRR